MQTTKQILRNVARIGSKKNGIRISDILSGDKKYRSYRKRCLEIMFHEGYGTREIAAALGMHHTYVLRLQRVNGYRRGWMSDPFRGNTK